jgi:general secretion pathway protein M
MRTKAAINILREKWHDKEYRRSSIAVAFLLGIYILLIPAFFWQKGLEKDLSVTQARYGELSSLINDYKPLRERMDTIEKKKSLTKVAGLAQAINDIATETGIGGKIKSIKTTGTGVTLDGLSEDSAEIRVEKLTMGESIRLFYGIENAPMILAIKNLQMRKSFENPELLDVIVTMSLFTPSVSSP